MLVLAIAVVLGSPVAFLTAGFFGVSQKRSEESRELLIEHKALLPLNPVTQ